jgi:hypothetical protein
VILANSPHIRFHQTSFQQTLQYDKIARRGSILPEKAKNKSPKKWGFASNSILPSAKRPLLLHLSSLAFPKTVSAQCELVHRRKNERMLPESAMEATMRARRTAGQRESENRADSAVATIWLVFYVLALGVAIASPFLPDAISLAAR